MFYSPGKQASGLPFNPFKSCCVPRPIGWLSTVSADGVHNLAPFSQFQNITWDPPTVMVAANSQPSGALKDTTANILATGEFVWNMATWDLRDWVVGSSRDYPPDTDEFEALGIAWADSTHVKPRRVAASPVQFECRLTQKMQVPGNTPDAAAWVLIAQVVGIHIDDAALTADGLPGLVQHIKSGRLRALAVTTPRRDPDLPEVPTMGELGFKTFDITNWYGVVAPAGTPAVVTHALHAALQRILQMPDVVRKMADLGVRGENMTTDQFGQFMRSEYAKYRDIARRTGVRLEHHAPGAARVTGSVEKAHDIARMHFETRLRFVDPRDVGLAWLNDRIAAWAAAHCSSPLLQEQPDGLGAGRLRHLARRATVRRLAGRVSLHRQQHLAKSGWCL